MNEAKKGRIRDEARGHLLRLANYTDAAKSTAGDSTIEDPVQKADDELAQIMFFLKLSLEVEDFNPDDEESKRAWQTLSNRVQTHILIHTLAESHLNGQWGDDKLMHHSNLRAGWEVIATKMDEYFT